MKKQNQNRSIKRGVEPLESGQQIHRTQKGNAGHLSIIVFAMVLVLNFIGLDLSDKYLDIPDALWGQLLIVSKDLQIFGGMVLANLFCSYKNIHMKAITFLLCWMRLFVVVINAAMLGKEMSVISFYALTAVYLIWVARLLHLKKIKSQEPVGDEAYYVFTPISTYWGLFQAVFMPWYPARYETRMICNAGYIWSVHHGIFTKTLIKATDIDKSRGVKIPLGRKLNTDEMMALYLLEGKKAIPGIRDCRKFLII